MAEDNTPTNVVDDFVITQDRFGRDVTVTLDNNGNIILYRATDDPNRIIDSDFRPLAKDKGSVGLGQQSYFSPNPMYSHKYQSSGRKNYKFVTEIKPNQILPTDDIVKNYPELVNALNIPEEFTNQNWRQLVNDDKAMIAMGYEKGGKRFFNDNIQTFIDNGIKAFGSGSTGTGGQTYIEYEIVPLVKEGDTLGIKPVAELTTKEGFAAGKSPEAFIETSLDTPTNVVDVGNVHDNPNYKVTLNVDNNGNVIIYRSTNTPDRFSDTDFSKFEINKTIGEQTYFASNPEFAQSFSQSGKRNIYSFSTNIKPEEILHLQSNIYKNKELLNKLGGQEYINNIINERGINNYRFDSLDNIPKNLTWSELYYSTNKGRTDGSKEILQREIVKLQNSGVKAIGVSPVSGAKNEYNILPIINEQSQLDIVAKGLFDKNLKETLLDTPTNVVDDINLSGTTGGITDVKGTNIAYVDVEEIFPYVEFDRRINPKLETDIDLIKQTVLDKGYMYDTGLNSGVVFSMYVDSQGNIMMGEGNHRIRALYEVAQETGQKIYIPINLDTGFKLDNVAEATKITDSFTVQRELNKLFKEFEKIAGLQKGDTDNWIITTGDRKGRIVNKAVSYLSPGNGLPQSSVARFLNAIGINAITYDELPDNSIYKTGVNTFTDTPTNVAGAEVIDEIEGIQRETIEKLRNANDAFVAEQVDDIMARKINEVLPFVDTSLSRAEAIGISTTGPQITTSADPVLNTFIDDIEKITGQTIDIYNKRKLRQFLYDVATDNEYGLLNDAKSFKKGITVNASKLNDPGYKVWKNWQNSGAFIEKNITGMTPNEFTAFGPPDYVYLVEGLENSGENINFTAISDADVNIPNELADNWIDNYAKTTTSFIDNLPLSTTVKNQFNNLVQGRAKNLATPGGVADAVDVWELGVLGLMIAAVAYKEYDEIPTILTNKAIDMFNNMAYHQYPKKNMI